MYVSDTMAVPPAYSDLGKAAKDIFSKGYGKNFVSLNKKCTFYNISYSILFFFQVLEL